MSGLYAGIIGFGIGLLMMLVAFASATQGTLDECRAAHPGYDCNFGWVVGEAFK